MAVSSAPVPSLDDLQERLGHRFTDIRLLVAALTHASYVNEHADAAPTYERLEFVGDAVLGLLCAELLYVLRPDGAEGELSQRRARVVRGQTLARLAQQLDLGQHVRVGVGQRAAAAGVGDSILADVFEAVLGALYVDAGMAAVKGCFRDLMAAAIDATVAPQDFKTRLQELTHVRQLGAPGYSITAVEGPSHARIYRCAVTFAGGVRGIGSGTSKKAAEQICAQQALKAMKHRS
jgi:ribonuclease-3